MNNQTNLQNPLTKYHTGKFPVQTQPMPGLQSKMTPVPDCGETSYQGNGKLKGRRALITGGDSGIGRAAAIAYAREGADVAINYHPDEEADAQEVKTLIEQAGQKAVLLPADLRTEAASRQIVKDTIERLGGLDILVLNAGRQVVIEDIKDLTSEELLLTYHVNFFSQIWSIQEALNHLQAGASIITTSSIQAYEPSSNLLQYATTKAAIVALTKALAEQLADKGIRVNTVAPGPIWTALQVVCGWDDESLSEFGQNALLKRAGQPAELADVYVFLASDASSYVTAQTYGITGGGRLF